MENEELPKVKHKRVIDLGELKIRVLVLDDGRRVIPEEDMKQAVKFLGLDPMDIAIMSLFK